MEVINYDVSGKVIPDLSKVVLPNDLSLFICNVLRRAGEK